MLDVRITGYVVPLAEQPQASLTPVIAVRNYADEDAVITGLIRIYRDSTGLMIYDSRLAVTQLEHGTSANIAALTPFDPPAPADDDYFIKADLVATSYLPGPPLSVTFGAWHFDIKTPPMGEAPAGHHVLHEEDGSDELETGDLGTTEMDDTLVLKPDGTGGVSWEASPAGVTDHGALTGLADDDHPQYRLRGEVFSENDFLTRQAGYTDPWGIASISAGAWSTIAALAEHPGILRFHSSTNANSGYVLTVGTNAFRISGSERSDIIIRPSTLALTTIRVGFHDTNTSADAVDGCYFEILAGVASGKTASNSARSTTGTNQLLVTNTWYRLRIMVNSDASRVDFYIFAENGAQLWTDFLVANIPTGAGRECGHAIVSTNSGTVASTLADLDYMNLRIARALVR